MAYDVHMTQPWEDVRSKNHQFANLDHIMLYKDSTLLINKFNQEKRDTKKNTYRFQCSYMPKDS
jgi:hypothetical protein